MFLIYYIITGLVLILSCVYYLFRMNHDYWKKRNVPYVEPSVIFGNYKEFILQKKYPPVITKEVCERFPDVPYVGVFYGTSPALIVKDPALIKLILTKDFYYFHGREVSDHTHRELVTQNLFFTQGDRWKVLRQNLTPLFTQSKMKNMFYLLKKCTTDLESLLERECATSPVIEAKALISRYTIDAISSCAFGVNTKTMGENEKDNPFLAISAKIFEVSKYIGFKNASRVLWPNLFYSLGFQVYTSEIDVFFYNLLTAVFKERNYEPSQRNDFVDLVLTLHQNKYIIGDSISNLKTGENKKISLEVNDDILVSQCILFFAGGFETSSSALSFLLYELAKHEEIQQRAIDEVDAYLEQHKDGIDFDVTEKLPYLDACFHESMRFYPLFGTITRDVMDDYTFPTGLKVQKGMRIHIPVCYMHMNPDYFPNPKQYNPERFLGENAKNIKPYTYFSFGEGPRTCIGMRFAKMQVLAGLTTILKNYRIQLADGMAQSIRFEPKVIVSQPAEGIWLKFIPRNTL